MIAAALIMAGALMTGFGPKLETYSIISLLCLAIAGIFILALFISITREGKPKYDNHERW